MNKVLNPWRLFYNRKKMNQFIYAIKQITLNDFVVLGIINIPVLFLIFKLFYGPFSSFWEDLDNSEYNALQEEVSWWNVLVSDLRFYLIIFIYIVFVFSEFSIIKIYFPGVLLFLRQFKIF